MAPINTVLAPSDAARDVAALAAQAGIDEEHEWEYEYDEVETEDFYFTLDLTTHVPNALAIKEKSMNGKIKPVIPAGNEEAPDEDARVDGNNDFIAPPLRARAISPLRPKASEEPNNLQVLDLHSDNPMIKFGSGIYSCEWSTDLGTQFYVSRPGVAGNPLRPGNIADVIGISQARLVSRPVTLEQRPGYAGRATVIQPSQPTNGASRTDSDGEYEGLETDEISTDLPGRQLVIPRQNLTKPQFKTQASFLERLSTIKLKKGETDPVPALYNAVRYTQRPPNWKDIQKQALSEDERNVVPPPPPAPKIRKRRRRKFADMGLLTKKERERLAPKTKQTKTRDGPGPISNDEIRASIGLQAAPSVLTRSSLPRGRTVERERAAAEDDSKDDEDVDGENGDASENDDGDAVQMELG